MGYGSPDAWWQHPSHRRKVGQRLHEIQDEEMAKVNRREWWVDVTLGTLYALGFFVAAAAICIWVRVIFFGGH